MPWHSYGITPSAPERSTSPFSPTVPSRPLNAPANTSLVSVVSPTVLLNDAQQGNLNVPLNGKAINAIRSFLGRDILVWGARTMDGNSQDWRYVNVRRTMIMLEQSIRLAAQALVFEPNTARTWSILRTMIANFLKWQP